MEDIKLTDITTCLSMTKDKRVWVGGYKAITAEKSNKSWVNSLSKNINIMPLHKAITIVLNINTHTTCGSIVFIIYYIKISCGYGINK